MAAALLHLIAHAAFKSLGFLGAGFGAGRDRSCVTWIDSAGLARRMPATTILFRHRRARGIRIAAGCGVRQ